MNNNHSTHIRHGIGAARAYIYGDLSLPTFVQQVFDAEVIESSPTGAGDHIEMRIHDSIIVIEAGIFDTPPRSSICVYVPDVDATYQRALQAGATSVATPSNKPYQERGGGIMDPSGNTWWITTYIAPTPHAKLL